MKQIITLSDSAALRIKEIMSNAEKNALGVRVGVKSGGCAGMSYVMEYAKEINPNDVFVWEGKGQSNSTLPMGNYVYTFISDQKGLIAQGQIAIIK